MNREEINRLLARHSSGELSAEERQRLFDAALDDQALFEELFEEDALREAMEDTAIKEEVRSWPAPAKPKRAWWVWAVPVAAAASVVIGVLLIRQPTPGPTMTAQQSKTETPVEIAQNRQTPPVEVTGQLPESPSASVKLKKDRPEKTVEPVRTFEPPPSAAGATRVAELETPKLSDEKNLAKEEAPTYADRMRQVPPPPRSNKVLTAANRPAAPVPERPAATRAASESAVAAPAEPQAMAFRSQVGEVRAKARKVAVSEDKAVLPMPFRLEVRMPEGPFRAVQPGEMLNQDAVLRLVVTPDAAGRIIFEPALIAPIEIGARAVRTVDIPSVKSGSYVIRLQTTRAEADEAKSAAAEFRFSVR